MKTIIGSAIGVMALGLILIGFGLRGSATPAGTMLNDARQAGAQTMPVADARGDFVATSGTLAPNGPVLVNCAPGQRALVRQAFASGQAVAQVDCVADRPAYVDAYGRPIAVSDVQVLPSAPRYQTSDVRVVPERTVSRQAPQRVTRSSGRGWKKPLLIIGGSTAAGAGIGGLVGGKKGALIGAALGGGASTIYEATRK
jgi:hypothetical protein